MRLTSSVKELEAILQKLIKSEPGLIPVNNDNEKHLDDVDGDADGPRSGDVGRGLGATTKRKNGSH
jgi:hypothetical protein